MLSSILNLLLKIKLWIVYSFLFVLFDFCRSVRL